MMEVPKEQNPMPMKLVGTENHGTGRLDASPNSPSFLDQMDSDYEDLFMITMILIIIFPPVGVLVHGASRVS